MKFAYADPPYQGQAKRHYAGHPDYAGEVDHPALIARLVDEFPDGWALSLKTGSLRDLLPLCPEDARVAAWVKPFAVFKRVRVTYAWEPVIFCGGRAWDAATWTGFVPDWHSAPAVMRNHDGTKGSKPASFCRWVFDLLGVREGDGLVDMFPGSGIVSREFVVHCAQTRLRYVSGASRPERLEGIA